MKFGPELFSMMVQSESTHLRDRIEEISMATRTSLAKAAEQVRQEIIRRHQERDDTLEAVAETLERLAYSDHMEQLQ